LQKRIIATFHYCLNHPGFLLLGRTESISGFSQFFTRTDRGGKTFARTARRSTLSFVARGGVSQRPTNSVSASPPVGHPLRRWISANTSIAYCSVSTHRRAS
jgi:two-component system CheB/CheR fusion protein